MELRPVEPARVVGDVVARLRRLLPESIEIELRADEGLPAIEADPDAIEQILMNLGTNARDAMPDGGLLGIELRLVRLDERDMVGIGGRAGEFVRLTVGDSGSGMAAQVRERVFEPFFTTKSPDRGSGLGLAIVYGLMEQHRGFAKLHSEAGVGTTVSAYFPVSGVSAPVAEPEDAVAEPAGGSETVLIAEDEASIREVARAALEGHGYEVLLAADGEEALSCCTGTARRSTWWSPTWSCLAWAAPSCAARRAGWSPRCAF